MFAVVSRLLNFAFRDWVGRGPRGNAPHPAQETPIAKKRTAAELARSMVLTAHQAAYRGDIKPGCEVWVIDLGPIRDILSNHWQRLADPVHQIARRIIGMHIGDDVEIETEADRYILKFASQPKRGWGDRVYGTAEGITSHLFGTGKSAGVEPRPRGSARAAKGGRRKGLLGRILAYLAGPQGAGDRRRAPSSDLSAARRPMPRPDTPIGRGSATAEPVPSPDDDPVPRAAEAADSGPAPSPVSPASAGGGRRSSDAAAVARPAASAGESAGAREAPSPTETRTTAQADEAATAPKEHAAGADGAPREEPASSGGSFMRSSEPLDIDPKEIERIERAIVSRTEDLTRAAEEGRRVTGAMLRGISLNYRPMWNQKNSIVAVYRCVPIRYDDAAGNVSDSAVLSRPGDEVQRAVLDTLVLHRAAAAAARLDNGGTGPVPHICLPVHASTLVARERLAPYLEECASLPQGLGKHLTLEIVDGAEYVGQSSLVNALQKLRDFARSPIVQLPLDARDMSFWRSAGFGGVAADIRGWADRENILIQAMEQFAFMAENAKLASYVYGTPSLAVTVAAVAAGFSFVGAGPVQRDTGPVAIRRYTLPDLYGECA